MVGVDREGVAAASHQRLNFSKHCGFTRRNITCKEEGVAGFPVVCSEPRDLRVCKLPPSLIRALGCAEKCPLSSVPSSPLLPTTHFSS